MASRLNFSIGSPVDPTQALQVSLGNIGKYFADFQDREMRREEKEAQQKRWEAENARAEATHKMQLDEYNRKVAERDALSGVFKDPSRMEAIVNQGVYSAPDALRISNEVADIGSDINKEMETLTAPVKARLAKDATSGIFTADNTFDATDTVESRMGSTRDILDRMGTTKDRSVVNEDTLYKIGGLQKSADMFAQEMLNSGSADSTTRFKDAVVGNMSKGQVRDMYMQGLLSQGVGLDNAMTLAKMYSDDIVTPAERRKALIEEAKVKNDIAATASRIGDRTGNVINVGGRGVDGEPLEDTGQPKNLVGVLKSYNDQAKAAGTKWNTNWLSTDSYTKLNDFINSVREHPDLKNQPEYVKAAMANAAIARTFNPHDWTGDADFDLSGTKGEFDRLLADAAKDPNTLRDVVDSWGQVPKAEKSRVGGSRNKAAEEFALTQLQEANALLNSKSGAPKSAEDVWTNLRRLTTEGPYNETRLTEFGRAMDAAKGIGGPAEAKQRLAANNAEYDQWEKKINAENAAADKKRLEETKKTPQDEDYDKARALGISVQQYMQLKNNPDLSVVGSSVKTAEDLEKSARATQAARNYVGNEGKPLVNVSPEELERLKSTDLPINDLETALATTLPFMAARGVLSPVIDKVGGFLPRLATDYVIKPAATTAVRMATPLAKTYGRLTAAKPVAQVVNSAASPVVRSAPIVDNIPAVLRRADTFVGPRLPVPSSTGVPAMTRTGQTTPPGLVVNTNVPYIRSYKEAAKRLEELTKTATNPKTNSVNLSRLTEAERVEYKRLAGIQ